MQKDIKNITERKGKTIVFYSYKGGVGRTMALVNIACLMAKQGKKILLIDWDLEAPGLHSYFPSVQNETLGLVDIITDVKMFLQNNNEEKDEEHQNNKEEYEIFLEKNLTKYISKSVKINKSIFKVDIIKAGKFNEEYVSKLEAINWMEFYKKEPVFFRTFAHFLEERYDYILIDSRTGLADTSGICTMLMPQILVLVFSLNHQNLNGVIDVARQSIEYRYGSFDYRNLTVLPLPSRLDNENPDELAKWIKNYKERFESLFKELYLLDDCSLDNYFNISKIPYKPSQAYGENIPTLTEKTNNDLFISFHYKKFLELIEIEEQIWNVLNEEQERKKNDAIELFKLGEKKYNSKKYSDACDTFQKAYQLYPSNDRDYYQWKIDALYQWGNALFYLAELEDNISQLEQGYIKYEEALNLDEYQSSSFCNRDIANQILNIPVEIQKQGTTSVADYLNVLKKGGKKNLKEVRIIILGEPKAGKTSLLKRIKFDTFNPNEPQTDGVNIEDIAFGECDAFKEQKSLHDITGHFWDFGGQEIMNAIHQFFLTKRSIYVLVLDTRKDANNATQIRYWMKRIRATGGDAPVLVLANQIDVNPGFGFENERELQEEFPQINCFIKVSCKNNENIDLFKDKLAELIPTTELFKTEIDERWISLNNKLQEETKRKYYLGESRFVEICNEANLTKKEEQKNAITFLHDLGQVLHFDNLNLSEYYVLNPYWITYGAYQILTSAYAGKMKGKVGMDELEYIVNEEEDKKDIYQPANYKKIKYSSNDRRFLIDILHEFKLCFWVPDGNHIIIPDLLDTAEPLNITETIRYSDKSIQFVYEYDYLPKSIMPNIMVETQNITEIIWRTGCVLYNDGCKALITNYHNRISIIVIGEHKKKREFMSVIRYIIDSINQKLSNKPVRLIPLPNVNGFTSYEKLLTLERKGKMYFIFDEDGRDEQSFIISELLEGIPSDEEVMISRKIFQNRETGKKINILQTNKSISIFLASSEELKDDRKEFEIFINRENKELTSKGIFLKLEVWEDFIDCMSPTRLQDEYNKAAINSDIFVSLFWTKLGQYTMEEFYQSYTHFKEKGKPSIYTYFKNAAVNPKDLRKENTNSLFKFLVALRELGHYPTYYEDMNDLKYKFKMQLSKLIE